MVGVVTGVGEAAATAGVGAIGRSEADGFGPVHHYTLTVVTVPLARYRGRPCGWRARWSSRQSEEAAQPRQDTLLSHA